MPASGDAALIEKARFLSQQARDPAPHYEHSEIGYNYRMSNIVAAVGRGQLRVLDERVEKKRWIFEYYKQALGDLPGIDFMPEAPYGRCTRWLTVVLIHPEEFGADREALRLALEAENIESPPLWKPMHLQPVFECGGEGLGARGEGRGANAGGWSPGAGSRWPEVSSACRGRGCQRVSVREGPVPPFRYANDRAGSGQGRQYHQEGACPLKFDQEIGIREKRREATPARALVAFFFWSLAKAQSLS